MSEYSTVTTMNEKAIIGKVEPDELKLFTKLSNIILDMSLFVEKSVDHTKTRGLQYDYSKESDVLKVAKPLFKKHGLSYQISLGEYGGINYIGENFVFSSMGTITFIDLETGCFIKVNTFFTGSDKNDAAKAYGKALTYGVKYGLKKALGLPDDDIDPDNEQGQKTAAKPKQQSDLTPAMETILKEVKKGTPKGQALKERITIMLNGNVGHDGFVAIQGDKAKMDELRTIYNRGQE